MFELLIIVLSIYVIAHITLALVIEIACDWVANDDHDYHDEAGQRWPGLLYIESNHKWIEIAYEWTLGKSGMTSAIEYCIVYWMCTKIHKWIEIALV